MSCVVITTYHYFSSSVVLDCRSYVKIIEAKKLGRVVWRMHNSVKLMLCVLHIIRKSQMQKQNVNYDQIVQYPAVQYSTVQYSTVQYSTVQYSTVQCSAVQCSAVQCSAVQCSAVQYSTVQYSTVQ